MARALKRHRSVLGLFSVALSLALVGFSVAPVAFAQTSTATSTSETTNGPIITDTSTSTTADMGTTMSTTTNNTGDMSTTTSGTVVNTGTTNTTGSSTVATTTTMSSSTPIIIMVMEHLCNSKVRNITDLSPAGGFNSTNGFLWAESNCPTTAKGNDMPASDSIAAIRTGFDYSVTGDAAGSQTLSNATYSQNRLCESQVNFDVNGDGIINPNTCLDTSSYGFNLNNTGNNQITVKQTNPPAGYHYGFVLFTPQSIQANDNASALVSSVASDNGQGTIVLNPSLVTDRTIMLHVFNLLDTGSATSTATTTGSGTATTTSATTTPAIGGTTTGTESNTGSNTSTATSTNNTATSTTNVSTSGGNSNTSNASTTATTTDMMHHGVISDSQFEGVVNILQRVEDIQSQIINLFQSLFSR